MSISHITNKMVNDKQAFIGSKMRSDLEKVLQSNILVAHNAAFDVDILAKEGVKMNNYIDTLKVTKFIDSQNEIPEYNLQYLRYFLDFDIEAKAHDATGDVLVLEKLFQYLYNRMYDLYHDENKIINEMVEISSKPLLLRLFNYGKHKGKKIEEVLGYDRSYLEWMLDQKLNTEYYDVDWIYTLKYHLKIN